MKNIFHTWENSPNSIHLWLYFVLAFISSPIRIFHNNAIFMDDYIFFICFGDLYECFLFLFLILQLRFGCESIFSWMWANMEAFFVFFLYIFIWLSISNMRVWELMVRENLWLKLNLWCSFFWIILWGTKYLSLWILLLWT